MEIILKVKDKNKRVIITSDSHCYTKGYIKVDEDGELNRNNRGNLVVKNKTYHGNISDCISSIFESELRNNDCKTLNEFKEHVADVKKIIYEIREELRL